MNKIFFLFFCIIFCATLTQAQQHSSVSKREHPKVEEIVNDLSATQKRQLKTIREDRKQQIDDLRKQQNAVRDSIHALLCVDGDQTATLYRLFDREATLQASNSKAMYAARLRIDAVLTTEQRSLLHQACKKNMDKHCKKKDL